MKRLIILIVLLSVPLSSVLAASPVFPTGTSIIKSGSSIPMSSTVTSPASISSAPNPCASGEISFTPTDLPADILKKTKDAFQYYSNPSCFSALNNRYELRFDFPARPFEINEPLTISTLNARDVYIYNFKPNLVRGSSFPIDRPLLEITNNNTGTVIVDGMVLSGVTDGLKLLGSGPINVDNSDISGNGTGTCLVSQGPAQTLKNIRVHGCHDGIRAEGTGALIESSEISDSPEGSCFTAYGTNHVIKASNFTNCKVGVKLGDETRSASSITLGPLNDTLISDMNFFDANGTAIYWRNGTGNRFPYNIITNSSEHSILIDNSVEISPGTPIMTPALTVTKPDVGGVLKCQKDPATGRMLRSLHFENTPEGLDAILYKNNISTGISEMPEYVAKCRIDSNGNCDLNSISSLTFSETECKVEGSVWVAAVVDSNTIPFTTILTNTGLLAGPLPPTLIGAGGTSVDLPSVPEGEVDVEDKGDTGDSMNAEGAGSGENQVESVVSAGPSMSAACSGMIVPGHTQLYNRGEFFILWWLIFTAPAVLIAVRIKKRK